MDRARGGVVSRGVLSAALAYAIWGVLPLYWKALGDVPALEILAFRIVGSSVVLGAVLAARRDWGWLSRVRGDSSTRRTFALTAVLLATNWLVYVWSNNNGHMVEASLGYFITPLVSVVLGLAVLRERLRPGQWLAVAIAASGAGYLVAHAGGALWVSLVLALSFGTYGLLRKTARLGSTHGLSLEVALLFLPAAAYLIWLTVSGGAAAARATVPSLALLAGAGAVTVAPLLLFAYGARRITLVSMGILQYLAPTLQFALGVFVYGESFGPDRLVGFALIWLALAVYTAEGILRQRERQRGPVGRSPRDADPGSAS